MKFHYNRIWVVLLIIFGSLIADVAIASIPTTVLFQPPPEEEQPQETEGAASRQGGECMANSIATPKPNLIALVPQQNYGLTAVERPNFWVYLPKTSAKTAILSIRKEGGVPHWQQSVNLTSDAGIFGIKLATDAPVLEIGQNYQWAVILVCGDRPSPNDPVITSWIRRVEKSAIADLDATDRQLDRAAVYARQGIWYDALNILLTERSPSADWHGVWQQYLASGGLQDLVEEPIIGNLLLE